MGIRYYTVFNPNHWQRDEHNLFEVYRLENGVYVRQQSNPVWMPEVKLGIGTEVGSHEGSPPQHWLYWYDERGDSLRDGKAERLFAPENVITLERQRAEQERQRADQAEQQLEAAEQLETERQQRQALIEELRRRGIDLEGF